MKKIATEIRNLVQDYSQKLNRCSEVEFSNKPLPHKWSKKEVTGHLVDSAHNNLRRFIVSQYDNNTSKIVYEQNFWVEANGYQHMKKEEVILLWKLINDRIAIVLENMPEHYHSKECNTGKEKIELHTLLWLAEDYIKHMKHHLNQIIPGSFDTIYTS
jgi:DinB superfamily